MKKPNPSPKHEAKETKSEERFEHKTGMEVQDKAGRKAYNKSRTARALKNHVKEMMK